MPLLVILAIFTTTVGIVFWPLLIPAFFLWRAVVRILRSRVSDIRSAEQAKADKLRARELDQTFAYFR